MSFRPVNPRNGILEAVVVIHLNRPAMAFEAAAVCALHPKLVLELPRLENAPSSGIFFQSGPYPPAFPVMMASYKKDGTLETRLLLNGSIITINFLLYTRWAELWPKAATWIEEVLGAIASVNQPDIAPAISIAAVAHQIIDVFVWDGAASEVSINKLFSDRPSRLPDAAWTAIGSPWYSAHSTNKSFDIESLSGSALVDVLNVNLGQEQNVGWRVRLEHMMEVRFSEALSWETFFAIPQPPAGQTTLIEAIIGNLHTQNHCLMKSLLRSDMQARIGLNTP